jgi:small GTP-binding protein
LERTIDLKLVILGEGGVGKTSIVNAFMGHEFSSEYLPTIGSNTIRKDYKIKNLETTIKVNIWDFGGQKSFNPFNPMFFKNIDIAILVFDLSKPKETLENIKQEFLENIQNYSEDFISIIVGNKVDLLFESKKIINVLNRYLGKNDHILLTSAINHQNIDECFELLIHTFLRKAELMDPDKVLSNTANEYLDLIGKDEKKLKHQLINTKNLESNLKKYIGKPKAEEKSIDENEVKELKYIDFLKQELDKNTSQKTNLMDQFLINLSELEKTIDHVKKLHSKSPESLISSLKELLITAKKDFEQNVESLEKLNIEEFELVKIISKTKEEKVQFN